MQHMGLGFLYRSKESGSGSGARKKSLVLGLIRACREKETKYIVRTLVGIRWFYEILFYILVYPCVQPLSSG